MRQMKNNSKRFNVSLLRRICLIGVLLLLVVLEISAHTVLPDEPLWQSFYLSFSRILGGFACIIFIFEFSFQRVMNPLGNKRMLALVAVIPAFAVAINNFPFFSVLAGDVKFSAPMDELLIYAMFCLSVGFFEEMAFRGCAFMFLLKSRRKSRLGIFIAIFLSSVVFGLIHFVNIFTSSPIAVLLQIGYSALIGALCSVVMLVTKNIWLCVLLHSVYNFCGGVVPEFMSEGTIWTVSEVTFTAILAVAVTLYTVWLFFKLPVESTEDMFYPIVEKAAE